MCFNLELLMTPVKNVLLDNVNEFQNIIILEFLKSIMLHKYVK